jgi:glycine oxidase
MPEHPDVLVIGGGVIGLTTAWYLAREGVRTAVIDQGDFGQESSWAGAGILPPAPAAAPSTLQAGDPLALLRLRSAVLFPEISAQLREITGLDNGYIRCGAILLGSPDTLAEQRWRSEGIAFHRLDDVAMLRLEPALAPRLGPGYHVPDQAQLRNPRHLRALLAACRKAGVVLRPGCPAHGFDRAGARITALRTGAGRLIAEKYLIAAGAWSGGLLEPLGWQPGIRPIRGQIALLNTGAPILHRIVEEGRCYLVPRPDGRVLVGSTEEDAGFSKQTTAEAIGGLLTLAQRLAPALAGAHLERCWAGLRPGSADGLPFLGPVPGLDNLHVAAGHFRGGISLSPATALVVKEVLLGQPSSIPLDAFRLDR